jgi:hypothetical protein
MIKTKKKLSKLKIKEKEHVKRSLLSIVMHVCIMYACINVCIYDLLIDQTGGLAYEKRKNDL